MKGRASGDAEERRIRFCGTCLKVSRNQRLMNQRPTNQRLTHQRLTNQRTTASGATSRLVYGKNEEADDTPRFLLYSPYRMDESGRRVCLNLCGLWPCSERAPVVTVLGQFFCSGQLFWRIISSLIRRRDTSRRSTSRRSISWRYIAQRSLQFGSSGLGFPAGPFSFPVLFYHRA